MKAFARLAVGLCALAVLAMIIPRLAEAGCKGACLGGPSVGLPCATDSQCPSSVCEETSNITDANNCVPGGKGSKDCFIEWSVTPQPPLDKNLLPAVKYDCLDNDPTCDADTTPGQCTFLVSACVNVTEGRFACTPTSAASYDLKKPSDKDGAKPHKDRFARDNRRNLNLGLSGLGMPTSTGNLCTPQSRFVVPLQKGATKKGKGKIVLKLTDGSASPLKDSDTLAFTCLPNPAIATIPCASARQITDANELIGGPLAMGRVGDWLIENDKVRFIIRDTGRDFSFMLTYGGHIMDADFQRKLGPTSLEAPYPAGRDSFLGITPLINISSTDNPTSITVVNDGVTTPGPAILRTTGEDDLFDPIDPAVAIKLFSAALNVPPAAVDNDIPVHVSNEYTLKCGDPFLEMKTTVTNDSGTELVLYIGDFMAGGGQLELVGPSLGFGFSPLRLGSPTPGLLTFNYLGWFGFGEAAGISYAIIPKDFVGSTGTSAFIDSGVAVPVYGQNLIGVLNAGQPGFFHVAASGTNSFTRWFAVSENGMGQVLDARHTLIGRGDIIDSAVEKTGFVQGTVRVNGVPTDGARVAINIGGTAGVMEVFETKDGGFFQGTLPAGDYIA